MVPTAPEQEVAAGSSPVLSPKELEDRLADADPGTVHVAVFFASWCPFCQAFLPTLDRFEVPDGVRLVQVDISDPDDAAWDRFGIETIPTAVRFAQGEEVDRVEAVAGDGLDPEAFRAFLDRAT